MITSTEIRSVPVVDRVNFIKGRATSAPSVLHVGCADAPYTAERIESGELLHLHLAASTRQLVGVDLDASALNLLRASRPDLDLEIYDVEQRWERPERFDLVVAGEVIEHLGAPLSALRHLSEALAPGGRIIVTVPNALALKAAVRGLSGRELVHPDHTTYFSPVVMTELARRAGLSVIELYQYFAVGSARSRFAASILKRIARYSGPIGDGLVFVLSPHESS